MLYVLGLFRFITSKIVHQLTYDLSLFHLFMTAGFSITFLIFLNISCVNVTYDSSCDACVFHVAASILVYLSAEIFRLLYISLALNIAFW